jgi:hypothetical protein
MDLLEHRARLNRLLVSLLFGGASGVGVVWAFIEVLKHSQHEDAGWFAMFTFVLTFVLVSIGANALLAARAKRRWRLPIPAARVVRR